MRPKKSKLQNVHDARASNLTFRVCSPRGDQRGDTVSYIMDSYNMESLGNEDGVIYY